MRVALTCVLLTATVAATGRSVNGQDADPTAALVARAGRYIQEYEQRFSAMVGEEQQVQRILNAAGETRKQRQLVSDFLFVKVGDHLQFFRDVIVVDGKPVRDREERLRKLFLGSSRKPIEQASAIYRAGVRYDLRFPHISAPLMLPLEVMRPRPAGSEQFRFAPSDDGFTFEEVGSPTMIRSGRRRNALRDMPLHGRLSIDSTSGALRSASFNTAGEVGDLAFDVRYAEEASVGMSVPVELRAVYRRPKKPKSDYMEVVSHYSNFRRFEVSVQESIKLPTSEAGR